MLQNNRAGLLYTRSRLYGPWVLVLDGRGDGVTGWLNAWQVAVAQTDRSAPDFRSAHPQQKHYSLSYKSVLHAIFTRVLAMVILSVRLSVCHDPVPIQDLTR